MGLGLATKGYSSDVTGGGAVGAPSVVVGINALDLVFGTNVLLTVLGADITNWAITSGTGYAISVVTVAQTSPTTIHLTTTNQTIGGTYTLNFPTGGVTDAISLVGNQAYNLAFTGIGISPSLLSAVPINPNTVRLVYNEAVKTSEALVLTNYAINKGLSLRSVKQESGVSFLLTTTNMTPNVLYTVTVSNIHDIAGNPVV
jgi:hypothetical protein